VARAYPILDIIVGVALVLFTALLVYVACLQSETLDLQRKIQQAATRSNVAPSYGGRSSERMFILNMANTGAIPARNVTVLQSSGLIASDDELPAICAKAAPAGNPVTIHPGPKVEHHVPAPPDDEVKAFAGRRYAVCGEITYRDELGEGVPSEFCIKFSESELADPERIGNMDHTICAVPSNET
jgi:hypothetical protein